MKRLIVFFPLLLACTHLFSQDFKVPNADFEEEGAYKTYEEEVVRAVDWLIETPINKEKDKRKDVNKFVMRWLTGAPQLTIEVKQEILTFPNYGDALLIFMGGWAKYAIQNEAYKDQLEGNVAGIKAVIDFYKKNKDETGENEAIEEYIELQNKNKLKKHIKAKL